MPMHRDGRIHGQFETTDPTLKNFVGGLNAMVAAINQNRPADGPEILHARSPDGTAPRARRRQGGGGATNAWTFKLYKKIVGTSAYVQVNGDDGRSEGGRGGKEGR